MTKQSERKCRQISTAVSRNIMYIKTECAAFQDGCFPPVGACVGVTRGWCLEGREVSLLLEPLCGDYHPCGLVLCFFTSSSLFIFGGGVQTSISVIFLWTPVFFSFCSSIWFFRFYVFPKSLKAFNRILFCITPWPELPVISLGLLFVVSCFPQHSSCSYFLKCWWSLIRGDSRW